VSAADNTMRAEFERPLPKATSHPYPVNARLWHERLGLATVTGHTEHGFTWKLDECHYLGPRQGWYEEGETYELGYEDWILASARSTTPEAGEQR